MTLKLLKKRLYTALSIFILCCFAVEGTDAQATFTLTEAQITGQLQQTIAVPSGVYGGGALGATVQYRSTSATTNFTPTAGSPDLALNSVFLRITAGAGLNLGNVGSEINLSNQNQTLFTALLALGSSNLEITYRLPIADRAWNAGIFTSNNAITGVVPTSILLTVNVPSFITVTTAAPTALLNVTSLANYRTGSITSSPVLSYAASLAADLKLKSTATNFSFSTTTPKLVDPSPAASLIKANVSVPVVGSQVSLSTADQTLTSNIAVQATNRRDVTTQFSISAADLKSSFVQAGTYTLPLTYTLSKNSAAYGTATNTTSTSSVQVVIPRLFEFLVQTNDVLFNINTIAAYTNGITTAMPNPIVLSSTVPYNITVKASGDFSNGSGGSFPANTMTIEGISTETGVTAVALTNASQNIVSGAAPVIDRNLMLQYRISAVQAANLLGKTAGVYQNTITFTCTAP